MDDLQIAFEVSLIEQTPAHVEVDADCLGDGVRQLVWIVQRADQLADSNEHLEPLLRASLFVDVLDDDHDASQLERLIAKRNGEHTRPDLLAVRTCVQHLDAGTHGFATQRTSTGPLRRIEQTTILIPSAPALDD